MKRVWFILLCSVACSLFTESVCAQQDSTRILTSKDSLDFCIRQAEKSLRMQNASAVFRWYRRAIRFSSSEAYVALGNCYYYGYGTKLDYEKAYYCFYRAAEQGNKIGEYSVGKCYYYGRGVKRSGEQAAGWYRI